MGITINKYIFSLSPLCNCSLFLFHIHAFGQINQGKMSIMHIKKTPN